ncbi:MAG: YhjD/YihY/BrkB family envelope integrity protein [Chlamydia sp.]
MKLSNFFSRYLQRVEEDLIFIRASSLTYQSFLALVPLLAVMFGIAKGFGIDMALENFLRSELSEHTEIMNYFLRFSDSTLQQVQGSVVAGTGIAFLFITAMGLFSSIEETCNAMWGIRRPRRYLQKASNYLAFLFICPLFLVLIGSSTIFFSTSLSLITEKGLFSHFNYLITIGISFLPFIMMSLLFSSMLYIIPAAQISVRSALLSGSIAAFFFQVLQTWYIQCQLSLTQISAIYGSFAALPLFLAWLWTSWTIFLLAGELSVLIEERTWQFSDEETRVDLQVCTLALFSFVSKRYRDGLNTPFLEARQALHIPLKLLYKALESAKTKKILHETTERILLPLNQNNPEALYSALFGKSSSTDLRTNLSPEILHAYEQRDAAIRPLENSEEECLK